MKRDHVLMFIASQQSHHEMAERAMIEPEQGEHRDILGTPLQRAAIPTSIDAWLDIDQPIAEAHLNSTGYFNTAERQLNSHRQQQFTYHTVGRTHSVVGFETDFAEQHTSLAPPSRENVPHISVQSQGSHAYVQRRRDESPT